jgi:hypothetical protein
MLDAIRTDFKVVHEGNTYFGSYKIKDGFIEVEHNGKIARVRLGPHDPVVLADVLMVELIKNH